MIREDVRATNETVFEEGFLVINIHFISLQ